MAEDGDRRRALVGALGLLLSLLALGWVIRSLAREAGGLDLGRLGSQLSGPALGRACGYAVVLVSLAVAWWWLLGFYGHRPRLWEGYSIWTRTQLAKYLPGNVFHYVGRHVLGRSAGLRHPALFTAHFAETLSLALAAVLVVASFRLFSHGEPLILIALVAIFIGAGLIWYFSERGLRRTRWGAKLLGSLPSASPARWLGLMGPAVALHAIYFVVAGGLLFLLGSVAWPGTGVGFGRSVWAYALAWIAGTFTPGAPAGTGVREAVLTWELAPVLGQGEAAMLALSLRLVTLLGDLISAGSGWLLQALRSRAGR